ncbi:MAG: 5'-3' exonuclease H3TH domain-containing protein [Patescibacteria group bacterium]
MEKLILIDGSGLIYRGFYAIPPFLKSPAGTLTNAVFGFTTILLSIMATQKPDYLAVAFDRKGPTFRHKAFEAYKATRVKAPQELYDQIPLVREVVETFGVPGFEAEGYEADDILATVVKQMKPNKNLEVLIATGDFDIFQIAGERVSILYPAKGFKQAEIMAQSDIEKKYGISPAQIPDYKGIAGDSSDNIPGVKGIGDKGAVSLLQQYGSLEKIYENLEALSPGMRKKLEDSRQQAFMSKELATLVADVPVNFDLEACRAKSFDAASVRKLFESLGFKSLVKRLDEMYEKEEPQRSLF